ncbi:conserved exported hypothetical protein [Enterobacterales bacterium 8AC]|nr:conserved exported hypothetical protein [Enterobacterales bacterium 8AC]
MNGKMRFRHYWLATTLLILSGSGHAEDVRLYGTLIADACVITPGDETVELKFFDVRDRDLYTDTRAPSQNFDIRLTECDLTLGNVVKVKLSGTESTELPGMLKLDAGSVASGVVIGLETESGQPLALNQGQASYTLTAGTNQLRLRAYIQGEPSALAGRTIGIGPFNATATFTLDYE